ncbi:MAG: DUF3810 family protein [Crocinitomicaceae bacterium]|nr:DUF3810 family protein [Crocinitomicaceae bacterium]
MKEWIIKHKHLSAFLFTATAALLFFLFPAIADMVYRRFLFQAFRIGWDYTIGFLPYPKIIVLLFALLLLIARTLWKNRRDWKKSGNSLLKFLHILLLLFFWMWGFNYLCPALLNQPENPAMKENDYYSAGLSAADQCGVLRKKIAHHEIKDNPLQENVIRQAVESFLSSRNWPVLGRVRCRADHPFLLMRRVGISGIYIPMAGEGYTSSTFLSVSKVFIMAHEMAHGYGITGEGEADFVAYMALKSYQGEGENYLHFAAELELLRSVRSNLWHINQSLREMLIEATDSTVNTDINSIKTNQFSYKEFFPGAGEKVNDTYLKAMGVNDGIKNYDRFVEMVWRERNSLR